MSFLDIRDQAIPTRFLSNILASGRIPNGLLFWGPAGVGKRLTAIETAKAINCELHTGDACGQCIACRKVDRGNHPDVKFITPSGRGRIIAVETVDDLNELASYRPFEGRWRVVIIQDIDRMNVAAQNHFLKTLEEPPSNTAFILLTEFPRILLPTIRSRCQQVRFGALRPETVAELIRRRHDVSEEKAMAIAVLAQGQMSRALDLIESEKRDIVLQMAERLQRREDPMMLSEEFVAHLRAQEDAIKSAVKAELDSSDAAETSKEDQEDLKRDQIALIESLIRRDTMEYLYLFKTWYRDVWVFQATGNTHALLNRDQADLLEKAGPGDLETKLAAIEKSWIYIERNLSLERVFRDLFFALAPASA